MILEVLLLATVVNAYGPRTVEVPPMDDYQSRYGQQPRRDSVYRNGQQVSYSYGTTAYHYNQQQPQSSGFASAHVTRDQNGAQSSTDQRPECQNPMLRMFFKFCHPPGAAPQSPVQCQPIPGQTSFRCMIKQQSWPVVRITQCPPGTTSSSGDCIRLPGSFSTNGVMIVPVVSNGQGQRVVQTSSVYRHCANGACQTCIGDQCSTTGVQTPMSVDHRGQANSTTEVVAFGDAGRDVRQKCANRICRTCIDRICYDRSYPLLRVTAGCPPAVCEDSCDGFVYWTDQCPICKCRGFACREPCRTQSECPAGSTCRNQVCVYAELPNVHFDKVCTFSSQCSSDQLCYNWRCGAKPALSRHLDQSCGVDQDCPTGYTCADMTCWQGEASRLRGQDCILEHQCPAGYFCTNGKCTDNYHHGSFGSYSPSSPTIPPTTDRQCEYDQQCQNGETCFERRCVTNDEYRRIDEARRRQQAEHQGWRPQEQYPTSTQAPPDQRGGQHEQASADDEYQRRLAEYNRQLAEQERQNEERRRQFEEERRRQEEAAETQRRRQEQEEADRRRQAEEDRRRQQEQEDERRRQELEDQRRRQEQEEQRRRQDQEEARRRQQQQEEENQRRIREQEEARRRAEAENQDRIHEQHETEQERQRPEVEEEEHAQYYPEPTPDVEIGEEASEDSPYDNEAEYERRMQEYNRQLKERQRQLQAEHDDDSDHSPGHATTENPLLQYGQVEVHDDENDFYGRTRQRVRPVEDDDQAVSSYRVRYHRVRRRQ